MKDQIRYQSHTKAEEVLLINKQRSSAWSHVYMSTHAHVCLCLDMSVHPYVCLQAHCMNSYVFVFRESVLTQNNGQLAIFHNLFKQWTSRFAPYFSKQLLLKITRRTGANACKELFCQQSEHYSYESWLVHEHFQVFKCTIGGLT
jgi:hypothetical protein